MYAVFSTGGKQYRATTGDLVKVEKLEAEKGSTIELDQVLMVGAGDDVKVGTPYVDGGKVTAKVVDHGRGDKVKIIKFKRRKHHMKQMGHRQYFTMLEITGIEGVQAKKKAAAKKADKPAEEKVEAKAKPKAAAAKKAKTETKAKPKAAAKPKAKAAKADDVKEKASDKAKSED